MNIKCNMFCSAVRTPLVLGRYRFLYTTSNVCLIQKWRKERGLPMNPNAHGVLTDSPDYSFLDGRPTPYGIHQRDRIMKQQEIAERIITLSKEMDFAVERHQKQKIEEENYRKKMIDSRLKPKGPALLKK